MATHRLSTVLNRLRATARAAPDEDLSDAILLEAFVAGHEPAAFAALVRRYGPMVLGVCRRVLRHDQDAEDALQATFLVLARKAAGLDRRELLANWLFGVAYRTALEARAIRARRQSRERQVTDMPERAARLADTWADVRPLFDRELERLPAKYRVVVVLCDLEGQPRKAVARRLKIPEGTLSSRLATARKLLAKQLVRHGVTLSAGALAGLLAQYGAAGVSAAVVGATAEAAARLAAGEAVVAGAVSARALSLAEGMTRMLFLSKLKAWALLVVILGLLALGGGAGFLSGQVGGRAEGGDEPATPPAPRAVEAPRAIETAGGRLPVGPPRCRPWWA